MTKVLLRIIHILVFIKLKCGPLMRIAIVDALKMNYATRIKPVLFNVIIKNRKVFQASADKACQLATESLIFLDEIR